MDTPNVTVEEILNHLSPEGRLHWELAATRALNVKLQQALQGTSEAEDASSK